MSMPFEWQLQDKINAATINKVDRYEVDTLRSNVDSLERTVRELCSTLDGVRFELSQLQESQLNAQNSDY